jgi:hypothetical protein
VIDCVSAQSKSNWSATDRLKEAPMDELEQIDVSPLDALTRLKTELETLDGRLQTMDARKAEVAEAVYQRVRGDYENRRRALEQEAAPLKAAAREQYARLYALLSRSEADHEAARLDREEIEFRHSLGEFDDDEFRRRLADVDQQLETRATAHERALELRQRFVAAFRSEEDLKTAEPADEATTQRLPTVDRAATESAATRPLPALDPASVAAAPARPEIGATQTMKVLKGGNGGPARPDQTVMIRSARLLPLNAEAGKLTHTVGLRPLTLGSAEKCDVRVAGAAAEHALIKVGMAGFALTDLGGGLRVNGVAIDQHLLRHDDVVEIGAARFVFRES